MDIHLFFSHTRSVSHTRWLSCFFQQSLILFALLLILTGCVSPIPSSNTSAMSTNAGYNFHFEALRPPKEILVCLDRTWTVPDSFYDQGLKLVARSLLSSIHTGQGSITITVRKIDHKAYSPEAFLFSDAIPAVAPQPIYPQLNPLLPANVKQAIMADYHRLQQQALQQEAAAVNAVEQIKKRLLSVSAAHVPMDAVGKDILGCPIKANEVFTGDFAVKHYLLLISDLDSFGYQSDQVPLALSNTVAVVVYYCTDDAAECFSRKDLWLRRLKQAGAQTIFYDVSSIDLIQGLFDQ